MLLNLKCPKCGQEMTIDTERGFSFCSSCGERVSFGNGQPQTQAYSTPVAPVVLPNPYYNAQQRQIYNNCGVLHDRVMQYISSPMVFAMAILQLLMLILVYIIGIYYNVFLLMVFSSIPAIAATIESWVTYGTAKWGKHGAKTAGLTVGKVFGVIHIVLSGIMVFSSFIFMLFWSAISNWVGDYIKEYLEFFLASDFGVKDLQTLITNLGVIVFFSTLAPFAFWIVLQVMLNKVRDNVRDGINGELNGKVRTIFPAVLLFLFALICVPFAFIFLSTEETMVFGLSVALHMVIFSYGGVLLIVFESKINGKN